MITASNLRKHITVEPAYIFFNLAHNLIELINTNLYLQKACRNGTILGEEPDLTTSCDNEKNGINFVTYVNSFYRLIITIVMILYVVLTAAWSDEAGKKRKLFMMISIVGQLARSILGCTHSFYWNWTPLTAVWGDLAIHFFFGGFLLLNVFSQIYICDVSTLDNRTMRTTILTALNVFCQLVGNGLSGFLMRTVGFFYSYIICVAFSSLALFCAVLFIEDNSVQCEKKISIWSVLNVKRIVDSFKVVYKKRANNKRTIIALLSVINILVWFTFHGEQGVSYLYFRYRFKWDEEIYGFYLSYKLIGVIIGTLFCSIILSKLLKIHDGIIGTFAAFCDTITSVLYIFATQTWQLYVIPLFDIFHGTALSICDSFQSKFFESHETGQLFSVHMTLNLIIPLCLPAYNQLFRLTMDSFPAALFLLNIPISILICILYCVTYLLSRNIDFKQTNELNQ